MGEIENRNRRDQGFGKVVEIYQDDGYSAAGYRPAYERLMSDVRKGKVTLIFVADYFRFCRRLLDYLVLVEELKKIGAKILSVKDNFDTETAMGQSMIRNYINMAQTERELTAERVSTNFHARALRGLRNGGRILYGYDRDDKDLARLRLNEREAAEIRAVFRVYIEEGSCALTSDRLNASGSQHKTKNYGDGGVKAEPWNRNAVHYTLRNSAYAGLREINKGNKDKNSESLKECARYQVVKASWPAIVDEATWKSVQASLDFAANKARERLKTAITRDYLLTGLLKCSDCGGSLMGAAAHGKKSEHRYYVHRYIKGKKITCSMDRIPADDLESAVLERLDRVLEDEKYLEDLEVQLEKISNTQNEDLKTEQVSVSSRLAAIEKEIKKTIQVQTSIGDESVDDVFRDQLRTLADEKRQLKVRTDEIERQLSDLIESVDARDSILVNTAVFKKAFAKSKNVVRKRLLGSVFQQITLGNCVLNLFYHRTIASPEAVQLAKSQKSSEQASGDSFLKSKILKFKRPDRLAAAAGLQSLFFRDKKVFFNSVVEIGRRTILVSARAQVIETIPINVINPRDIIGEICDLYNKNLSLRDIAKQLNLSKTTVREHLIRAGVVLRPKDPTPEQVVRWRIGKTKAPPPFGFCYFQGKLVKNPIEYDTLLKIHRQWKAGMGANELTRYLNTKKLKPRKAKEWHNKAVKKIVARFETKKIVIKGGDL
jgi:site-specific DNA recombinase